MKRPTVASLKKVTAENLVSLGPERLAEILVSVAQTRPEVKRRLRMELAAEQGAEHLLLEIDRRLGSLQSSRSRISWRNRATFVRDLDALRVLIADRLAGLDPVAALDRLWRFLDLARALAKRVKDKDGRLEAVFQLAAADLGRLLRGPTPAGTAQRWAEEVAQSPVAWTRWLPSILDGAPAALVASALGVLSLTPGSTPAWFAAVRQFADAVSDADAFAATFTAAELNSPAIAGQVALRLLNAGRLDEAGARLRAAAAKAGSTAHPDLDWESAWIEYLDRSGEPEAAQAARWSAFERTLSVERARAFTRRLADFEDVEAEERAFAHAAGHPDFARGLAFLMTWPAYPAAAQMIAARAEEACLPAEQAETWAARLRARHPAAAHTLLRKAAAAAFRRRDFATCDRLTQEADAITPP